jgi:hypothetical protein
MARPVPAVQTTVYIFLHFSVNLDAFALSHALDKSVKVFNIAVLRSILAQKEVLCYSYQKNQMCLLFFVPFAMAQEAYSCRCCQV